MVAYRICRESDPSKAFSGQGARNWGGRWNSPGIAVVYTAGERSLAMLEVLVHLKGVLSTGAGPLLTPYHLIQISFASELLEEIRPEALPAGWNAEPATHVSQSLGDAWAISARSPILAVPSVIIPEERNYILNPNHPRFKEIRIGETRPCAFDPRLF
jgi:RES domain-containing protein